MSENTVKYRNLAILAVILLVVGFSSGWILGGDQIVREDEIAPQPVQMLLSGTIIVAIAVLLFVNLGAEMASHHSEVGEVMSSTPPIVNELGMQVELSGDTQAVVGRLATQTVKVTNSSTGEPVTDVQVGVQSVALESGALMFAYQDVPDITGKLTWSEQFFDGAPHQVTARVTPLESASRQFKPLQVSQSIEVEAIAPPLFVRFISLSYFTLIFVAGLVFGFWRKKRKQTVKVVSNSIKATI